MTLFPCTSLQSTLVHCRLGLPATKIDLAYLYKALAFTYLYVLQSCYHKSSCLSTSGHTTSTPAILTSLLHFDPLSNCSSKSLYSQIPPNWYVFTTIHIFTDLVKAQLSPPTRYSPKRQDYNLSSSSLDDRLQEPTLNLQLNQIVTLFWLNFNSSQTFIPHLKPLRTQSILTSMSLKSILDSQLLNSQH